jgi:hypothetical protein
MQTIPPVLQFAGLSAKAYDAVDRIVWRHAARITPNDQIEGWLRAASLLGRRCGL